MRLTEAAKISLDLGNFRGGATPGDKPGVREELPRDYLEVRV
jgi:hypothetical protein